MVLAGVWDLAEVEVLVEVKDVEEAEVGEEGVGEEDNHRFKAEQFSYSTHLKT